MFSGSSSGITEQNLKGSDIDSDSRKLRYILTKDLPAGKLLLSRNGRVEAVSVKGPIQSFTQEDINTGLGLFVCLPPLCSMNSSFFVLKGSETVKCSSSFPGYLGCFFSFPSFCRLYCSCQTHKQHPSWPNTSLLTYNPDLVEILLDISVFILGVNFLLYLFSSSFPSFSYLGSSSTAGLLLTTAKSLKFHVFCRTFLSRIQTFQQFVFLHLLRC